MLLTSKTGRLATGMLGATFLMATMLLSGCDKIADIFSSENSFLSSMNGRWSDKNNNGVMFYAHGGMLVGIDTAKAAIVIQPKGKLDADNHMLPVKMTIISSFTTEGAVYLEVAKILCPSLAALLIPENGIMALVGAENCIRGFTNAQGLPKLAAAKASMKEGQILENMILYNASQKKGEVRIGVKTDDGKIIFDLNFVRKLSDEEQKSLETVAQNPRQKFAASDGFVDKTIDELVVNLAKSEAGAKKAEAKEHFSAAFSKIFDAARPLLDAFAKFMVKTGADSLPGDNTWKELGLETTPAPTKEISAFMLNKSGIISVTVAPGVIGTESCGNVTFNPRRIGETVEWTAATTCPDPAPTVVAEWNQKEQ